MVAEMWSGHGVGPIHKIYTKMDQYVYKNIRVNTIFPYGEENMSLGWRFMHDNDQIHTLRVVKSYLEENSINVLKWPAQSPDLNLIKNLWKGVEQHISAVKPKNLSGNKKGILCNTSEAMHGFGGQYV